MRVSEELKSTINHALTLIQDTSDIILFTDFIEYVQKGINNILSESKGNALVQEVNEVLDAFRKLINKTHTQKGRMNYFNGFLETLKGYNLIIRNSTGLSGRVQTIVSDLFENESPTSE